MIYNNFKQLFSLKTGMENSPGTKFTPVTPCLPMKRGGEGNLIFFYTCLPSKKQSIECKCFQLTFASSCFRLSDVIYEQLKRQLSKQFAKPCNVECMTLYFLLKHIHTSVSLAFTVGWYHFNPIHINVTKFSVM